MITNQNTFLFITWICCKIVVGSATQEIAESGKVQYQLLKERGNLPNIGECWKQGIEHLEQGCRYLTENAQSQIALHLTNCFLKMSGHDTYNCDSDRKQNLRAICINNMSDRAFNVYTEFYTHIQNICGFLQGHIWQEIISENTVAVGKKLKETAQIQEGLLQAQKESLELQEKMLQHGRILEHVLEDLFISFQTHHDALNILSQTITNLQNWIVGEMSWFDSIIFYTVSVIFFFIFTSSERTNGARLLIFFLLLVNFFLERLICCIYLFYTDQDTANMYTNVYSSIWFSRYIFMILIITVLIYFAVRQFDPLKKQYHLLCSIQDQNFAILNILKKSTNTCHKSYLNNVNEVSKSVEVGKLSKRGKELSNEERNSCRYELNIGIQKPNVASVILNQSNINPEIDAKKSKYKFKNNLSEVYNLRSSSRSSSLSPN